MDDEPSWQRQLAIGLGALLAIAVLIGAVLAVIAVRAADYVGIGDTSSHSGDAPVIPPTAAATKQLHPTTPASPTSPTTSSPASTPHPPVHVITLTASPRTVGSFERINLTGSYPGGDGTALQVQRSVGNGPWSDFPTDATVREGRFATYVKTAMLGLNHFRMLDKQTGKTSNAVAVTIG